MTYREQLTILLSEMKKTSVDIDGLQLQEIQEAAYAIVKWTQVISDRRCGQNK